MFRCLCLDAGPLEDTAHVLVRFVCPVLSRVFYSYTKIKWLASENDIHREGNLNSVMKLTHLVITLENTVLLRFVFNLCTEVQSPGVQRDV